MAVHAIAIAALAFTGVTFWKMSRDRDASNATTFQAPPEERPSSAYKEGDPLPQVFLDISVGGKVLGRVVIELRPVRSNRRPIKDSWPDVVGTYGFSLSDALVLREAGCCTEND